MNEHREAYDKIQALNFSNAKRLLISPKHFKEYRPPEPDLEHLVVGSLVHAMVLEGKDLRKTYALKPEGMSFATNEGKAWKREQKLPILDSKADERIPRIADAIAKNKKARAFIKMCPLREHVLLGEINGVKCKGLVDMMGNDAARNPGFAEIKTLPAIGKWFLKERVKDPFHIDLQVVWYRRLVLGPFIEEVEQNAWPPTPKIWSTWIFAENRSPFDVCVYPPSDRMLASGEEKLRDLFTTWHACQAANSWPGVQPDNVALEPLEPPRWRLKEMEHEYEDY